MVLLYCEQDLLVLFLHVSECFLSRHPLSYFANRKRLKIPIHSVVHVEHDPIASVVSKFNHKDDGIIHFYLEEFEDEVYGTKEEPDDRKVFLLIDKYGPFDLVLGGAPCQSLSQLNASRDISSENAKYLAKVGKLIQKLDEIQMGQKNVRDNVIFLSENVVFKERDEFKKYYKNPRGESLNWIRIDAKDFGPCKRDRLYWMNVSSSHAALCLISFDLPFADPL